MTVEVLALGAIGQILDGPHATPRRVTEGPYFLNISALDNGRLNLDACDHVSEPQFSDWTRRVQPQPGDLLFSYETRLGQAALMPDGVRACLGRRMALIRPDTDVIHPAYLLYYYLSPDFQRLLARNTIHGATVNRISLTAMGSWLLRLPGLPEQRAIAEVLRSLDDKIGLERQIVTAAQRLSLLMVERSVCNYVPLGDMVRQHKSAVHPLHMETKHVWHYSLPSHDSGRRPLLEPSDSIKSAKLRIDRPSVLMSKLNPRFPRVWDVPRMRSGPMLASTEFLVLEPEGASTSVLAAALLQPNVSEAIDAKAAGTSGSHQRVRPADLLSTLVPDIRTIPSARAGAITSLMLRAEQAREETAVLAALRDALLPELVAGRLRVQDAEQQVGEVL